ncbi:hypothetical protein ACKWRH_25315 [Bradyrhizobium sp. Pa8]|uniref:hypothetical protein n=1 Tax=Bradyrhizobium sp. Pa8 TaxID=3386552 RepID=UPI00403F5322
MKKANGYKTAPFAAGKRMGAVERALRLAGYDAAIPLPSDDFFGAVVKATKAFGGAKLRAACGEDGPTVDLILWLLSDRPLNQGDRRSLATLLAGELNSAGRPRAKASSLRNYVELLTEAKQKRREFSGKDAGERAAKWAARDPRALNKSASTIARDMERKRSYWDL